MPEDLDTRRRRAAYRAAHRGTKEMDALIGRYADARLPSMSSDALNAFEKLLTVADPILQTWIFGREDVGQTDFAAFVRDIRAFHGLNASMASDG